LKEDKKEKVLKEDKGEKKEKVIKKQKGRGENLYYR
jgi:hypothetical protein